MRASTVILIVGVIVFALPIPVTFILGALIVLGGLGARVLGH